MEIVETIYLNLQNRKKKSQQLSKEKILDIITKFESLAKTHIGCNLEYDYQFHIPHVGRLKSRHNPKAAQFAKKYKTIKNTMFRKTFNEIFKKVA